MQALFLAAALVGQSKSAEAAYDNVPKEYREQFVAAWKAKIEQVNKEGLTVQRSIRNLKTRQQKRAAAARVKVLEKKIKALKSNRPPFVPSVNIKVGSVGRITARVKIIQVVDSKNAIAAFVTDYYVYRQVGGWVSRTPKSRSAEVWLSGVDTKGFADGKSANVDAEAVYRINGNKTYDTVAGGTRTLLVLEPFDTSVWFKTP